jgi:hypothetical protein
MSTRTLSEAKTTTRPDVGTSFSAGAPGTAWNEKSSDGVAGVIVTYTSNFEHHVERLFHVPPEILNIKRRWPTEAVFKRHLQ